jgi:hypothetical protein
MHYTIGYNGDYDGGGVDLSMSYIMNILYLTNIKNIYRFCCENWNGIKHR